MVFFSAMRFGQEKYLHCCYLADSPARAIVRNVKQYNGMNGCDWCEFEGVAVSNNNGPPLRYYPHRTPVVMHTAAKKAKYALEATPTNPVKGVKGMTYADLLPSFDTVRGTVTDFMHPVCLGVLRQMVDMWFNSKNHCEHYIGQSISLIDQRLQLIIPPSELLRFSTMARKCIDDCSAVAVIDVLVKLMYDARYGHKNGGDVLSVLGSCEVIILDACMLGALQDLLGVI